MAKSNKATHDGLATAKHEKPREDFPLFPHRNGRWAKKIRGQFKYFGKVADDLKGEKALLLWLDQKDDLLAGRKPREKSEGVTLADLCNAFLESKEADVNAGKLSLRMFADYRRATDVIIDTWGRNRTAIDLRPEDFTALYAKLTKKHGVTTLGREITMIRGVFKFGMGEELLDRVVRFGSKFKQPSKADKRKAKSRIKHEYGARVFTSDDIQQMLGKASLQMRAMLLLGINCGLGNSDCSSLPLSALDLDSGWLDFPRVKTGIERRCPLWPETVAALRDVLMKRKHPSDQQHGKLVFLTRLGQPWVRYAIAEAKDAQGKVKHTVKQDDAIAKETKKLLLGLGIYRPKVTSFYTLRHTTETIGGGAQDQVALDAIMGHVDGTMAADYREHIEDSRLLAVTAHIRRWLYGDQKAEPEPAQRSAAKVTAVPSHLKIVG